MALGAELKESRIFFPRHGVGACLSRALLFRFWQTHRRMRTPTRLRYCSHQLRQPNAACYADEHFAAENLQV